MKRSSQYTEALLRATKKARTCKRCGEACYRKRELMALLDAAPSKKAKPLRKLIALAAAQLDGYCSAKCRGASRVS